MSDYICQPRVTKRGIAFTVVDGADKQECLISRETLEKIALLKNVDASDAESMDIFNAFEGTIDGVARRLMATSSMRPVILLQPELFQ